MSKIIFLVLHYKYVEITKKCVDSLVKYNQKIVIMDNGSNNGSGEELDKIYEKNNNIDIIIEKESRGFSAGNNHAYRVIKERKYEFDFIIACNNDLVFEQEDFLKIIIEEYEKNKPALIGPDIILFSNKKIHQNPWKKRPRNIEELEKNTLEKKNYLKNIDKYVFYEKSKMFINKYFFFLKKMFKKNYADLFYNNELKNCVLQGSCLIFTPVFFQIFKNEELFYPETLFYHEEEILWYRLRNLQLDILYSPKLKVYHNHSASTSLEYKSIKNKLIFQYNNYIKSDEILINYIKGIQNQKHE